MGAQIGRNIFGFIGGVYYDFFVISKIKAQLEELNNFNRIHYPMQFP